MTTRIILTVIGSDQPGLTQAVANAIHESGGNWLESHLSRLAGKYVGSVLAEIDPDALPELADQVKAIDASGLQVTIVSAGEEPEIIGHSLTVELVGQDRPGIVREVTGVLARLSVNIEQLETRTRNGAWSGEVLFEAKANVTLPFFMDDAALREALEEISGEIMVDFTFS